MLESEIENIHIFIEIQDHKTYKLNIPNNIKIKDLKIGVSSIIESEPNNIRIYYNGKLLDDNKILFSYNIKSGMLIHVSLKNR